MSGGRPWRIMIPLVVAFAFFLEQLDITIITTAIPNMARGLGETPLRLNIALTSYVLALAVFIPVSGWVADRFGMRRTFCTAITIFTLGSVACGSSVNLGMLVASRLLQGFGGAMLTPVGRLILLRSFPRSELVSAMTWVSIPSVLGPVMGPLVGGFITTYWNWRWIFFVNVPFGLLGIALALRVVPADDELRHDRFDWIGFALCGLGMALVQFGIENLSHAILPAPAVVALFAGGGVLLVAYARYARRRPDAAVDLGLFRVKTFRVSVLMGGVTRMAVNGVAFLLPLMLQVGFGLTPLASGQITFISSLGTLVMRTMTVSLLRRMGFGQLLVVNTVLTAAAIAAFAAFTPEAWRWLVAGFLLLFGMIRNLQFNSLQTLTFADISAAALSRATGLSGMVQQLSMGFGVSLSATLLGLVGTQGHLTVAEFHTVFLLLGAVPLLALPSFLTLTATDGAQVSGHRRRLR
jgi:EmrB/QacA subfamily drug resistance transporter